MTAECKEFMVRYMRCLRENSHQHAECRLQAKDYLQCRMDKYVLTAKYCLPFTVKLPFEARLNIKVGIKVTS